MERQFIDDRVAKIIELKRQVCDTEDKSFVIINENGIDPASLSMLASEGILALRRAKRINMKRCEKACGGVYINSVDDLSPKVLGFARNVNQLNLGEQKYTFIEGVDNPLSCTILIKGPNKHTIQQVKDAIYDGVRSVKNALENLSILPGAGAFELAAYLDLIKFKDTVSETMKLGIQVLGEVLLVIPKTLAINSSFEVRDTILKLEDEHRKGNIFGLNVYTGYTMDTITSGIYDVYRVKRNLITSVVTLSTQLLLVDGVK